MDLETRSGCGRHLSISVGIGADTLRFTAAAFSPAFADSASSDSDPVESILATGRDILRMAGHPA